MSLLRFRLSVTPFLSRDVMSRIRFQHLHLGSLKTRNNSNELINNGTVQKSMQLTTLQT